MAARTTRQAAREKIRAAFEKSLDQVIPLGESTPLKGRSFLEWEDQADGFDQAIPGTLLEARAALEETARVEKSRPVRCPHCGSDRLYLQRSDLGNQSIQTPRGEVTLGHQRLRCRSCGRSFPPQAREWGLSQAAPLSPRAHRRIAREAVNQPYPQAAKAVNEDWWCEYDGKQIQRWTRAAGEMLLDQQHAQCQAYEQGRRPQGPANDPELLVVRMDGGRVQNREKNSETGGRRREDRVLTISRDLPGEGRKKSPSV